MNEPILKIGTTVAAAGVIEAFRMPNPRQDREGRLRVAASDQYRRELDISWLSAAAETYKVSPDLRDYVIVEIPIVTVDVPNRNMDAFPYEEVTHFHPLLGRMVYKTFVGKPTHKDHQNKDPLRAKGVHFDASLGIKPFNPDGTGSKVYKISVFAGFDRTKDPDLVRDILSRTRTGYSMGALVDYTRCSVCGQISSSASRCEHMAMGKGKLVDGKLIYDLCHGVNYIETSSVADPADVSAHSNNKWV
jgi:hypothetical protein